MSNKINLSESLKKITEIVRWFDEQKEIDVEAGLSKVKEGADLIKKSRERLKEIENEFAIVKKEMDDSSITD